MCVGYFLSCCDPILNKKHLKEGHLGSQLEGTVCQDGGFTGQRVTLHLLSGSREMNADAEPPTFRVGLPASG